MKKVILDCFKDFKCIAGACRHNCCIGWEIDIDNDTMKYYNTLENPIKSRLTANISQDATPHFILDEKERCPFLNSDNLCDIIITLGEDKIPYICKNHPRFFTWLPDRTETGMGLCCEVATRLLFASRDKLNTQIPYTMSDSLPDVMTYARQIAYSILQNRTFPISSRLALFLDYCKALDEHLFFEDTGLIKKTADLYKNRTPGTITEGRSLKAITALYHSLSPIDETWSKLSSDISENHREIKASLQNFHKNTQENFYKYEHLAIYFTYRHFLNCLDDYDILSAGRFIVLSTLYCGVCDAYSYSICGNPLTDEHAKLYSKQVEYSTENTDKISGANIKNIKGLLPLVFGR
ncbi:MAG: hypothetical protein E7417_00055 [Ruminococcaceae bacterium]|nr:hypothetical protein [Oscillospiraceae bacterium]